MGHHLYCFQPRYKRARQLALRDLAAGIDEETVRTRYALSRHALAAWRRAGTLEKFKREELKWQRYAAALDAKYAYARTRYADYWLANFRSTRGAAKHFGVTTARIYEWLREDGLWPDREWDAHAEDRSEWKRGHRILSEVRRLLQRTNRQTHNANLP